jgi:hypothetical protein
MSANPGKSFTPNSEKNPINKLLDSVKNLDEDYIYGFIWYFIFLILLLMAFYLYYIFNLEKKECNFMENIYSSLNGNIRSINSADPDCSGNLNDYYIKTAYNACSGGSYKNDFVNICNLKTILKQGVRGLDFQIFSVDNKPVVSTSTQDSVYIKETYNSVPFSDVMNIIQNYGFSGSTAPNYTDPIVIHLRFNSNNQKMYSNLANIFKSYDSLMLGSQYSFENDGLNLGRQPLLNFKNKIILIVDKTNNSFMQNQEFLEYVNMTSNSVFMRSCRYNNDVVNNPDVTELTEYNKTNMTIVLPDNSISPANPSGLLCRNYGCQMVALRYQYVDNFLEENALFFDGVGYAFVLKPAYLRYTPVTIPAPTPQKPELSYATRNATTDYYSFNF